MSRKRLSEMQRGRRAMGALGASFAAVFLAWGCGSSDEKLRAAELAGSCSINSDCKDPYVCAFGRCHVECEKDRDCRPVGLRCMNAPEESDSVGVCQLPEEVACETDRDCPGDTQVCGVDKECRDPCDGDDDCTETQICANSNECASTDSDYDLVDENGNIVAQAGSGGAGGSSGKGGSSGSGGSSGKGGSSGSGGSGASVAGGGEGGGQGGTDPGGSGGGGAVSTGGGGGDPGGGTAGSGGEGEGGSASPGSGGASAGEAGMSGAGAGSGGMSAGGEGGGSGEFLTEPDDGTELVSNDTREEALATPLSGRATIYVTGDDHDWFAITVPDDGRPHVISVVLQQESGVSTILTPYTAINYARIGELSYTYGITGYGYITAGSGATILLEFRRALGAGGAVHLSFDVQPENDAHEPNNTKATAAEIERELTYSGIVSWPWISDLDRPYQDWYAVDLEAGAATFSFSAVPSAGRMTVFFVNPAGATQDLGMTGTGAIRDYAGLSVPEAGTYYFVVQPGLVGPGIAGAAAGARPAYLTEPYSFSVTQP